MLGRWHFLYRICGAKDSISDAKENAEILPANIKTLEEAKVEIRKRWKGKMRRQKRELRQNPPNVSVLVGPPRARFEDEVSLPDEE